MYAVTMGEQADKNFKECALGNDKMYALCISTCNKFYTEIKTKIDYSLATKKRLAQTRQEVKDY